MAVVNVSASGSQKLERHQTWMVISTYLLFIASTFSIAGINASVILLYLMVFYHRSQHPLEHSLPRWLVGSFLLLPMAAIVSALVNWVSVPFAGGVVQLTPVSNLAKLRELFRIFLPLAMVPALVLVNRRTLLLTLLGFTVLVSFYGIIQFFWGVDWLRFEGEKISIPYYSKDKVFQGVYHAAGNFSHHLTFSGVMLMLMLLFFSLALEPQKSQRWIWAAGSLMAAISVVVAMGRSGWLGMSAGLLLVLLRFPRRLSIPLTALVVSIGLIALIFSTGWLNDHIDPSTKPPLVQRFLSVSPMENQERLHLWESALMGVRERPWFGVGEGNSLFFAPAYRYTIAKQRNFTFEVDIATHMHNVYLQVIFELGIFGLSAYLLWLGAVLYWIRLSLLLAKDPHSFESRLLYGSAGGLGGIMIAAFFENNFFDSEVQTLMLILIGLALHAGLEIRKTLARDTPAG